MNFLFAKRKHAKKSKFEKKASTILKCFVNDVKRDYKQMLIYAGVFFVAIIYWEVLLYSQIHSGFKGISFYFLLFAPAQAVFFGALNGFGKNLINRIITPVLLFILALFYCTQLIYFRIFGSLFSISMLGMGGDAIENFGWALWSTIKESVGHILLAFLPVFIGIFFAVFKKTKQYFGQVKHYLHAVLIVCVIVLWLLGTLLLLPFGTGDHSAYQSYHDPYMDTDTAAEKIGVFTNTFVEVKNAIFGADTEGEEEDENGGLGDIGNIDEPTPEPTVYGYNNLDIDFSKLETTDKGKKALNEYFSTLNGTQKNEYTGLLKDYNLIYVCAESFSKYAIDPLATPTLYKMSQKGIILNNYYNSFRNTTTNGEFAFMTGIWPDVSRKADMGTAAGSFAQSAKNLFPFSLANLFNAKGIPSRAFHNYYGSYYSRNKTHPNLGYTCRFMGGENGMKFSSRWPASDLELMEQSIDDYINDPQFHTYYMTFSGHGPYNTGNAICARNIKEVKELTKDTKYNLEAKCYLSVNYELDKAMEYLLQRLKEAGKDKNTLIVITGDHFPYYLSSSGMASLNGDVKVDETFDKYHSSCIMYTEGLEQNIVTDNYCCNVDIIPTVLNLFGLDYDSRLLPGVDVLSNSNHMAVLYNKSFITELVKYNGTNGRCTWSDAAANMSDEEKNNYIELRKNLVKSRYTASLEVVKENYFQYVMDTAFPKTEQ